MPLSILIVDDDLGFRRVARELLTGRGFAVAGEAGTLGEARTAIGMSEPNGILLDVNLPDGDGFELAAELRGTQPATRVLLTSNDERTAPSELMTELGPVGFVPKRDLIRANLADYFGTEELVAG